MILSTHGIVGSQIQSFVGLLDTYPNAAAAYSVRKLRTAYTGSAIRVRRTDLTESDIGFTTAGNLDTTALLAFTGTGALDNGFITTWYDQSGNSKNAVQTTALNQPKIVNAGVLFTQNSKPTIYFDGTNDFFTLSSSIATSINYSFFSTAYNQSNTNGGTYMSGSTGAAEFGLNLRSGVSDFFINKVFTINVINAALTKDRFNLNTFFTLNAANSLYSNSSLKNSNTLTPNFTQPITTIGRNNAGTNEYYLNGICEMILYSSNQASNQTGIESNINTYYAIY